MVRWTRPNGATSNKILGLLVVVLLLAGVLAGCTDKQDDPTVDGTDEGASTSRASGGQGGAQGATNGDEAPQDPGRYRFEGEPTSREMTASGSFSALEHCVPIHCLVGDQEAYTKRIDLEEVLPVGVPMQIQVELRQDSEITASIQGHFESDGVVWNHNPLQTSNLDDAVTAARPDAQASLYYILTGQAPEPGAENPWELHVEATPLLDRIPPGIPVAFTVDDPEQPPMIRNEGLDDGRFMLFDPDDDYLGSFWATSNLTRVFQEAGKNGEYVIFAPWESTGLRIESTSTSTPASPPTLRVIGVERTLGEYQMPLPETPAEWDFPVEKQPLAMGLLVRSENGYFNVMSGISLKSPDGTLIEESLCGFCTTLIGSSLKAWVFDGTHTLVVPGSYHAEHHDAGYGEEATHFALNHVR